MKYKYLLFDWDGTLSHTLPAWITATRKGLLKRNIDISDARIVQDVIINLNIGLPAVGVEDVEKCIEEIVALEEIQTIHTQPLHENIFQTLHELRKKAPHRALVTNNFQDIIIPSLELHKLHDYFKVIISGEDVKFRKPHPEPLLTALNKLDAADRREEALMIGDSITDVLAARAAGMKSAFHYPAAHEPFYEYKYIKDIKPDYIIRDFKDLLELV